MNKAPTDLPAGEIRILIAEDDKNIGDLITELLSGEGRELTVVHDGAEALRLLKQRPYDLLITDLMMPGVDGMEVLHQARRLHPQILVIIITGYASLETAIQAVKEGAYDYLRKPFRLDELKISVDNACERIQLLRENRYLLERLRGAPETPGEPGGGKAPEAGRHPAPPSYFGTEWLPPAYFQAEKIAPDEALSELERLGRLLQQGLIDENEFAALKKRLIGRLV
ncbi:response regulator [Dissulfurirhabdus thermomarina]|uniref:Response regulator n=1 Tax=Dissulfurirhabdus thermomarina TaxID=1765737 RepID=A0A6N9TNX9_DISTH|nr:response regulator [Dissulfurirhabdus thermomarina]NDY42859.1 response regulator [Dissulfurirhabdus thermomarina]NMX23504.1 response regulator [Dissulfurirhabdus thermomarina]